MKQLRRWQSPRLGRTLTLVRWGQSGAPVLFFPTAGGDAEEIERFHLVGCLAPLIDSGRITLYSVDSVSGQVWLTGEGDDDWRLWLQNEYQHAIRHEVIPTIQVDLRRQTPDVIACGASLGAFHAAAMVCRFPEVFSRALCLSGTFDLERVFRLQTASLDLYYSSPLHFLPQLENGALDGLRQRFVLFAAGEGRAENIGDSWRLAGVLGAQGVPNRVDNWGPDAHHDWPLWRTLAPKYLADWT
jgi:esterase/lipase superfamily enzyme